MSYLFFGAQRRRDLPAVGRRKEIGEDFRDLPEVGRLFVNLLFIWREEAQRRKEKTLCVLAALRANFFFFSPRRKAAKNLGKLLAPFLLCVILFISYREICSIVNSRANQSTQPQGAGGVSMGLVRSNLTENNVADPSLLKL